MTIKHFIVLTLISFYSNKFYTQIAGESTYQFLNISSSPRNLALGGGLLSEHNDDVSLGLTNPSLINQEMDNKISINYLNYFADISYGSLAYAYRLNNRGNTLHIGFNYINYGDFTGYDEFGNYTNDFTGSESSLAVGYSSSLTNLPIKMGVNFKVISSSFEQYNSIALASDFGLFYNEPINNLNISLVFRNIGFQIKKFNETSESLPFEINLGFSQKLDNAPVTWYITFQNLEKWPIGLSNPARITTDLDGNIEQEKITIVNELLRHTIIGVELFQESFFNLRFGYNFRRSEELRIIDQRNFSGISFGFGLKFNKLTFNYCHSRFSVAENVNFVGLQIDLN